ncbi:helix-turn-helix domain-containing protein [Streptococcus sp. sy010]|uniref:winged helix-turn-helix transcriptional regulator n=1 Tax=Streptococcus sp. sy010 TaxID=2600148 RepID=UPI0011B38201|nr:helix-turn-helix domain-containing protein [Streptococcus sp. sy010]TWT16377.1 helix-turn-helix transcriptional regulator [Streptococcus sp. sy010]
MAKICPKGFQNIDLSQPSPLFYLLYTQDLMSGRWKWLIVDFLIDGPKRFSQIQKYLGNLSQGSLTKQLREMEADGLVIKTVYPQVPPRVDYQLSQKGRDLFPILELMIAYGEVYGLEADTVTNQQAK